MQFGKVARPDLVDFTLPQDHPDTKRVLESNRNNDLPLEVYVGCAKWNRTDLKGFYPRGTKDELSYYSRQFNCIELNATFYGMPDHNQVVVWKDKTPAGFKFFPKLTNSISHYKRLTDVQPLVEAFCDAVSFFEEKLGMAFLQLHDNFGPKDFEKLQQVVSRFPKAIPLAVEVRNEQWFADPHVFESYTAMLETAGMTNIIVDTAGRRDMLHMRLTGDTAFVRYVGANHPTDISRLDSWVARIVQWRRQGLQKLYFFVHQNTELESPLLAAHFIAALNRELQLNMTIPAKPGQEQSKGLFD